MFLMQRLKIIFHVSRVGPEDTNDNYDDVNFFFFFFFFFKWFEPTHVGVLYLDRI